MTTRTKSETIQIFIRQDKIKKLLQIVNVFIISFILLNDIFLLHKSHKHLLLFTYKMVFNY